MASGVRIHYQGELEKLVLELASGGVGHQPTFPVT